MNRIANILVIVDPTADAQPAVAKAALLAEKFHARLELFACETKASRETRLAAHMRTQPAEPFVVNLKAMLESLATPLRARGLDVSTETVRADPLHVALLERTQLTTADLVVKDTHHHTLAKRTILSNTDWHLIRGCPVPLLLTKPTFWSDTPRIVAAVDPGHANDKPSALDLRILDHAALFAQKLGGELHALHAYIPMSVIITSATTPPMAGAITSEDLARDREMELKQVSALVSDYAVTADRIHLEAGGTAEVLSRIATHLKADIMAMGAISRSGLKRAFVGSTAEDVLEHLPCDALIVKSPNFADLLPF